jgi:hypothetical protein
MDNFTEKVNSTPQLNGQSRGLTPRITVHAINLFVKRREFGDLENSPMEMEHAQLHYLAHPLNVFYTCLGLFPYSVFLANSNSLLVSEYGRRASTKNNIVWRQSGDRLESEPSDCPSLSKRLRTIYSCYAIMIVVDSKGVCLLPSARTNRKPSHAWRPRLAISRPRSRFSDLKTVKVKWDVYSVAKSKCCSFSTSRQTIRQSLTSKNNEENLLPVV